MQKIINRTPHAITLIPADAPASVAQTDKATVIPAAAREDRARVRTCPTWRGEIGGVDVLDPHWGSIAGLEDPQPGVVQVVSVVVVQAAIATGRTIADLAVPGDQVRDDSGRIVACRGLTMGDKAFPRLNWQRTPRLAVFGSAARWLHAERLRRRAEVAPQHFTMPDLPPAPRDIDVAYIGMDEHAARSLVWDWLCGAGGPLRERFDHLPLDLHCTAELGEGDKLAVPRPAALGDGDDLPLDASVCVVFGGNDVEFRDMETLPAVLRRAATLLVAGRPVEHVAALVAEAWPGRVDVLIGDRGESPDCYLGSSTAALRRALDKLGTHREPLANALRALGLPIITVMRLAYGTVRPEVVTHLERGYQRGYPICRLGRDGDRWYIGAIHGDGPWFNRDDLAAAWLTGE